MTGRLTFLAVLTVIFGVGTADAFQKIPNYVKNAYKEDADYKAFFVTFDGLQTKCDVCHIPGANKKEKGHGLNDFGKVFHDRFKHRDFTAADKDGKTDEAMKTVKDAWEKSIKEKNAEGKVYGDLIKEGKLPGKNN